MIYFKFFIFIFFLILSPRGFAGTSDPGEIVEKSRIEENSSFARSVEGTLKKTASQVKNWWNEKIGSIKKWEPFRKNESQPSPQTTKNPSPHAKNLNPSITPKLSQPKTTTTSGPPYQSDNSHPHSDLSATSSAPPSPTSTEQMEFQRANQDIRRSTESLKKEGYASIHQEARKGQTPLKMNQYGVPYFPMEVKSIIKLKNGKTKVVVNKLKSIPLLDIGTEKSLVAKEFILNENKLHLNEVKAFPSLPSPEFVSANEILRLKNKPIEKVTPPVGVDKKSYGIDNIVTRETILKAIPKLNPTPPFKEKIMVELNEGQQQMLTALILYNKGERCHILLGLFDSLAKNKDFNLEANFHLGKCADKLKMHSLAFERLSKIIQTEDKDFTTESIQTLAQGLPKEYELAFYQLVKNSKLLPERNRDLTYYLMAKGAYRDSQFNEAKTLCEKINDKSSYYGDAQYLIGLSLYSMGQTQRAYTHMESLKTRLGNRLKEDKNLNSLIAINLARMKFTQGKFKEALQYYISIDKDHPLWVQGLIEQGWTQLSLEDYAGAIGNMYSLHSPYFKTVYKPESFVVRTIGYLKICQYGDAYRTLSWLEHDHARWIENINNYLSQNLSNLNHYEMIKSYLKGKSDQDVSGLPHQALREMARQKGFLNIQTSLNEKSDEASRYDNIEKAIQSEKGKLKNRLQKATTRITELQAKIKKAETDKSLRGSIDQWKQQIRLETDLSTGFRFLQNMLVESQKSYAQLYLVISDRLDKERAKLREKAGQELYKTITNIKNEIKLVLDNNEFLRYDIFANSGENIRYQVAGGNVDSNHRIPASAKPTKLLNWSFDGEYWEDEIGSYRSSLKNNCPESAKMDGYFKDKKQ
ncbi:MAG: hypothetical protein K1X29_10500 [Bdellovibrionales bacterium]|nr:hypothetical protein [Bdellovibrionales bacterium]